MNLFFKMILKQPTCHKKLPFKALKQDLDKLLTFFQEAAVGTVRCCFRICYRCYKGVIESFYVYIIIYTYNIYISIYSIVIFVLRDDQKILRHGGHGSYSFGLEALWSQAEKVSLLQCKKTKILPVCRSGRFGSRQATIWWNMEIRRVPQVEQIQLIAVVMWWFWTTDRCHLDPCSLLGYILQEMHLHAEFQLPI